MKHVLVVDDEKMNLKMVERVLKADYALTLVSSGEEALRCLALQKPDLILLDILMPGMDGFETMDAIRKNEGWKEIPIMLLTADTGEDVQEKAKNAGVFGVVEKPFKREALTSQVKACIG